MSYRVAESVVAACLDLLNMERSELIDNGRSDRQVMGRVFVAGALRRLTTLSLPEIAAAMGLKHHGTVADQCKRFAAMPKSMQDYWAHLVRDVMEQKQ